jgi:hypothetical protein
MNDLSQQDTLYKDAISLASKLNSGKSTNSSLQLLIWLVTPNNNLDGKRPMDMFTTNSKAVLDAARHV